MRRPFENCSIGLRDVSPALGIPMVLAILAAACARFLQRRLQPRRAAILLCFLAAGSAAALFAALSIPAFAFLADVGALAGISWCRDVLTGGHAPSPIVGAGASIFLGWGLFRGWQTVRRQQLLRDLSFNEEVVVVPSDRVLAYAVPGRPGHVVVSAGMLDALDDDEYTALLAHERAHLDGGHHRFVLIGNVAAAAFPILRPLARQIEFSTERCADETAAAAVGDRSLVARAIAAAAFASRDRAPSLGLVNLGVVGRVEALLEDDASGKRWFEVVAGLGLLVVTVNLFSSLVELHHFIVLAAHICGL